MPRARLSAGCAAKPTNIARGHAARHHQRANDTGSLEGCQGVCPGAGAGHCRIVVVMVVVVDKAAGTRLCADTRGVVCQQCRPGGTAPKPGGVVVQEQGPGSWVDSERHGASACICHCRRLGGQGGQRRREGRSGAGLFRARSASQQSLGQKQRVVQDVLERDVNLAIRRAVSASGADPEGRAERQDGARSCANCAQRHPDVGRRDSHVHRRPGKVTAPRARQEARADFGATLDLAVDHGRQPLVVDIHPHDQAPGLQPSPALGLPWVARGRRQWSPARLQHGGSHGLIGSGAQVRRIRHELEHGSNPLRAVCARTRTGLAARLAVALAAVAASCGTQHGGQPSPRLEHGQRVPVLCGTRVQVGPGSEPVGGRQLRNEPGAARRARRRPLGRRKRLVPRAGSARRACPSRAGGLAVRGCRGSVVPGACAVAKARAKHLGHARVLLHWPRRQPGRRKKPGHCSGVRAGFARRSGSSLATHEHVRRRNGRQRSPASGRGLHGLEDLVVLELARERAGGCGLRGAPQPDALSLPSKGPLRAAGSAPRQGREPRREPGHQLAAARGIRLRQARCCANGGGVVHVDDRDAVLPPRPRSQRSPLERGPHVGGRQRHRKELHVVKQQAASASAGGNRSPVDLALVHGVNQCRVGPHHHHAGGPDRRVALDRVAERAIHKELNAPFSRHRGDVHPATSGKGRSRHAMAVGRRWALGASVGRRWHIWPGERRSDAPFRRQSDRKGRVCAMPQPYLARLEPGPAVPVLEGHVNCPDSFVAVSSSQATCSLERAA
mmetsp:Transcript_2438/g.9617  ORF Transcript_2438/g.9617 Transcript_2438/m.9617 type:complete len:784 (+) Transcript_2438:1353-3704(+)